MRKKKRPNKDLGHGQMPERLKWRPRFRVIGFLSGLIGGLGAVILVAQYGVAPLGRALSVQGLGGALLSGLILPSAVFAVVVSIHNKRLDRALAKARTRGPSPTVQVVLLILMAAALVAPFVGNQTAHAEVSGPCGGEINGVDLQTVKSNASDAFEINEGDTVRGSFFIDETVVGGSAGLNMFGSNITVVDEPTDPNDSDPPGRESFEFEYDDISWLGSGLMGLWAEIDLASGQTCSVDFMINIDGNPLETVVGVAAAGAVGVGAAGMTLSGAGAVLEGGRVMGDLRKALYQIATSEGAPMEVEVPSGGTGGSATEVLSAGEPPSGTTSGLSPPDGVPSSTGASSAVTVESGDNLWSMSENELQNRLGRPPTEDETRQFWQQVVDSNSDNLQSGDPDLIYPGETIEFPPSEVLSTEVSTDVAGVSADAGVQPEAVDAASADVSGGDSDAWWADADAEAEPRQVIEEGAGALADAGGGGAPIDAAGLAGIAGLAGAFALVPARYLLLAKLSGAGEPGITDPRLSTELATYVDGLPISPDEKVILLDQQLDIAANTIYDRLVELLANDFHAPSSVPDVGSWPPRVGSAVAWMHVSESPPLTTSDIVDVCSYSLYVDAIRSGEGRGIDRIEEKAVWPWT